MPKVLRQKLKMQNPLLFGEFFASGHLESISPFLTPQSRKWAKNLSMKVALSATFLWIGAFVSSFYAAALTPLLLLFVYALVGIPALIRGAKTLAKAKINIDVLMILAAFISIWLDAALEGSFLLVLFYLSSALERSVLHKAKSTLNNLHYLSPAKARIQGHLGLIEKSVKDIACGELIFIRKGDVVPLDGEVVEGTSQIDISHLTGENIPARKTVGDIIPSGAL